jgi:hypothetical protein
MHASSKAERLRSAIGWSVHELVRRRSFDSSRQIDFGEPHVQSPVVIETGEAILP